MKAAVFSVVLLAAIAADSTGVLFGRVTRGPLAPVQREGVPSEAGVANARIEIVTPDGKEVASTETDSEGHFRVEVPAGTYKVEMPSLMGAMFTKDLPATVTLGAGQKIGIEVHLDTGIR